MNTETQNKDLDQSQEELDSLFGGDNEPEEKIAEKEEPEQPAQAEQPVDKVAKKAEDFEKALRKYRDENKRLKTELETRQAQPQGQGDEEAVKFLKNITKEAIDEHDREREAVSEIKNKPYFDVLQPKILEHYKEMPEGLSENEKLERSYEKAAAQNLDLVAQTALQVGQEAGFKNRSFKAAQGSIKAVPRGQESSDDWGERYKKGESTIEEDLEHADEITQLEKEELGI